MHGYENLCIHSFLRGNKYTCKENRFAKIHLQARNAYGIVKTEYTQRDTEDKEMETRDYLIELRDSTGMSRKEFCEYFEIPYRTLQDWELGNRKMPDYLLRLMAYKIEMEKPGRGESESGKVNPK